MLRYFIFNEKLMAVFDQWVTGDPPTLATIFDNPVGTSFF
jgi:hypothetical protein